MIAEKHIGISALAHMTRRKLRDLAEIQIVHYRRTQEPAAVLIPNWMWIRLSLMLAAARDVESSGEKNGE